MLFDHLRQYTGALIYQPQKVGLIVAVHVDKVVAGLAKSLNGVDQSRYSLADSFHSVAARHDLLDEILRDPREFGSFLKRPFWDE